MTEPEVVWKPTAEQSTSSGMGRFRAWLRSHGIVDAADYDELWRWSVNEPAAFWGALAEHFGVAFHEQPAEVVGDLTVPGASWFPGSTLNYAEHALRPAPGKHDHDLAVVFRREDGQAQHVTHGELRSKVAAVRAGLRSLGVGRGDRVVALVPNSPEALIAFLATASLGAIWSSCSPDFGVRAVTDRFAQLDPTVLVSIDGYVYNGKTHHVHATTAQLESNLPTLRGTVVIDYLRSTGDDAPEVPPASANRIPWPDLIDSHHGATLEFEAVPFDHPLWILYSSGTTGLPKGIVHGHGGITLEHIKALALHFDAGPGDRFLWFTTTGWMMWNFVVSGLLVGCTVVLYDGSPAYPGMSALWDVAADEQVTVFGTSAPFIQACLKAGLTLDRQRLSSVRTVGSTGAPLSIDGFRWLESNLGSSVQIASFSGGTDLCTGFIGPSPDVPVWLGELSRPSLGAAVAAYDESGHPVVGQVGELVLTRPMPSMPVSFWNDDDGSRLREAYFADFPGVWRHGDWITITHRGSAVIHGRSDSTLNRGGVRMGTAEFYRVVESDPGVRDSLVIDTSGGADTEGELLCFLALEDGARPAEVEDGLRHALRAGLSPRHVPDRFVVVGDIPRTLNGKKCEVPVKKILSGGDPRTAVSREALRNPESIEEFVALARSLQPPPK
ncbi:acetoacetate--CoA ligase [Phytoactinopolyspora alkaliphila]|uniref:Acetoacetate--CoA ligase n=1 Tax=Phytoactinopolyspora alkaliphila TaxID=1783498 RepID=A0A6N9YQ93_9ACTN|nr:acetoacetate--CoA ligase [Phytoactinopolyspora alkaliphila]NED97144.1 acetoacetate--CoA ligase [Phytoactinopolyspora alkaliphila]